MQGGNPSCTRFREEAEDGCSWRNSKTDKSSHNNKANEMNKGLEKVAYLERSPPDKSGSFSRAKIGAEIRWTLQPSRQNQGVCIAICLKFSLFNAESGGEYGGCPC